MPVKSSDSPVINWPGIDQVIAELEKWADALVARRGDVVKLGYFGSYARGDWSVGSDLDLVIVLSNAQECFERRAADFDTTDLPVPVDLLVYTMNEWENMKDDGSRFYEVMEKEGKWIVNRSE